MGGVVDMVQNLINPPDPPDPPRVKRPTKDAPEVKRRRDLDVERRRERAREASTGASSNIFTSPLGLRSSSSGGSNGPTTLGPS